MSPGGDLDPGEDAELLTQGKEPSRVRAPLRRRTRTVLGAVLALAVASSGARWGGGSPHAAATTAPQGSAASSGPAKALVPRVHQVHISTAGQHASVSSRGHIDLDLQLVNDGSTVLSLLNVRMPQPGVRADPGPGGLVSAQRIALLRPDTPTPITLHLFVGCPEGLSGQPADHLELTLRDDQGFTRTTSLDLRPLPGFWDHLRHSACSATQALTSSLVVDAVPTSVRWSDGSNGP